MMVGLLDVAAAHHPCRFELSEKPGETGLWLFHAPPSCTAEAGSQEYSLSRQLTAGWYPKWFQALEKVVWFLLDMAMFGIYDLLVFKGDVLPDFMMSVDFGENFHPWASECLGYLFGRWRAPGGGSFDLPWIFGGCWQYKGTWRIIPVGLPVHQVSK